jgi:uncharacterized protein YigE (DUF2233 family)
MRWLSRRFISGSLLLTASLLMSAPGHAQQVDVAIALAADVSLSVDQEEFELQRRGYAEAVTSPRFLNAVASGPHGAVALCFIEWAGVGQQAVIANWTIIRDGEGAADFAKVLLEAPRSSSGRTAIGDALDYAVTQINAAKVTAERRVIDVSGDGTSNLGRSVTAARDDAIGKGITINGLAIINEGKQPNGQPYGSLQNIPRKDGPNTGQLVFAMNAGIYQVDRTPLGLYVENGRELVRANTASGAGNFYIKPNGIFYVNGGRAGILETRKFLQQSPRSDIATQSGPMLVINGAINPRFSPNSDSRKIRNGVSVQEGHEVVFVISNDPVTFSEFARFFRDALHCSNALYLDGSISSIYAPSVQRADFLWPLGPIIGVYARID